VLIAERLLRWDRLKYEERSRADILGTLRLAELLERL
jgi:hypothetical protein